MLKKLAIVALLGSVLLSAACAPDTRAYKNTSKTGDYFFVNLDPKGAVFTVEGTTITVPMTDATFTNTAINGVDNATDIFVSSYDLEFDRPPDCPSALCPPLSKIEGVSCWINVPAGGTATLTAVPLAFNGTLDEFMTAPHSAVTVVYKGKITFHGENEFGYLVKISSNFSLFLPSL